ncbi:M57 family metalloprotease [Salinibacillus kushneri]|nr:M57 family metalloprotease [Salinibacillus kushneri]
MFKKQSYRFFIAVLLLATISFGIGNAFGNEVKATPVFAWDGHWSNEDYIQYVNNVSYSYSRLQGLVNNAALDNVNNHQYTVSYVKSGSLSGRHVLVEDVNLSSARWTGKAEGASYNWDANDHYYGVNVKLNVGNGILNYDYPKLKGLIAHELVHAIGLQHRDSSSYLMYPYDSRDQYTPNETEDATIMNHYYHQN